MNIVKKVYRKFGSIILVYLKQLCMYAGYLMNESGVFLQILARKIVRTINYRNIDETSDWYVHNLRDLHRDIRRQIKLQKIEYPHYSYFGGYPYQALGILGIFGDRSTEERFEVYGLGELIGKDDYVLDIGCNCGFVGLYASFRTGCHVEGVDINPYMINIGNRCASYLRVADKVTLKSIRFQDFNPTRNYSVVFSFATHWTDDKNYRVNLTDHLKRIHAMMDDDGILVFESHCNDVGEDSFYASLNDMTDFFEWEGCKLVENQTRELYIMKKLNNQD